MKNRFYARKFLNRRGFHAGGYVLAVVPRTDPSDNVDRYFDACLELTDCSRHVSFEFPLYDARQRENSVRKARMLADVLAEFADALEIEATLGAERARRRPKRSAKSHDLFG